MKLQFTLGAINCQTDPFAEKEVVHEEVLNALQWQCAREAQAVIAEREQILARLEALSASMWASGECEAWFAGSAPGVRDVARTVCGPLLELLAKQINHPDQSVVELFRRGAQLFGILPVAGLGEPSVPEDICDFEALRGSCAASNAELISSLREDEHSLALHELTMGDFAHGRVSKPVRAADADCTQLRLVPRFAVLQGVRPDGSDKIRAVDNFSWSPKGELKRKRARKEVKACSVNGHCYTPERVAHDHLDDFAAAMRAFMYLFKCVPGLWKADIDAAFRRVPLLEQHKWAAAFAYMLNGEAWFAVHNATPFGASSSVYAWHRVGALIGAIARKLLHLPVFRYVDDYFAVERLVPRALRFA